MARTAATGTNTSHPEILGIRMRKAILAIALSFAFLTPSITLARYAEDRAEIEDLSNKYMIAVDAGDIDTVMSTWADDGVLYSAFGVARGKAAIRKTMSAFGGALQANVPEGATFRPRTHHQIINHVIEVHGNTATTVAYWFAITNATPQHDVQLLFFGHYEDTLVKINGHWLFKTRRVYNESEPNRAAFYPGLGEKDPRKKP